MEKFFYVLIINYSLRPKAMDFKKCKMHPMAFLDLPFRFSAPSTLHMLSPSEFKALSTGV